MDPTYIWVEYPKNSLPEDLKKSLLELRQCTAVYQVFEKDHSIFVRQLVSKQESKNLEITVHTEGYNNIQFRFFKELYEIDQPNKRFEIDKHKICAEPLYKKDIFKLNGTVYSLDDEYAPIGFYPYTNVYYLKPYHLQS